VSRYKFDRSREFIPGYKAGGRHWRSVAVQVVSEAEYCQGTEFLLRAAERIRVPGLVLVPVSGSESCKKHDKQLTFIDRVSVSFDFTILILKSIYNTFRVFDY